MHRTASSPFRQAVGLLTSFLLAALLVGLFAGLARSDGVNVGLDQAELVRLEQPGAEVIIGNPSIADVSVQSGSLLVLTGKSVGLTNLIVLDGQGQPIYEDTVHVAADTRYLVTVNKGTARETHSCAPNCGPALVPGDAELFFEPLAKETRNKLGLAQSAVDGTTSQQ